MKLILAISCLVLMAQAAHLEREHPTRNHKVYRVILSTDEHFAVLNKLESEVGIDFWDSLHKRDRTARIMVAPSQQKHFEKLLKDNGILHKVTIENVEAMVLAEQETTKKIKKTLEVGDDFKNFWTLDEIENYLTNIADEYADFVKLVSLGKTTEGRDLWALQISVEGAGEIEDERPIIIVDATIHAREWIAPMNALFLINQLVVNRADNEDLLTGLDWIIVPVVNPDGYAFTHAAPENRLHRKTKSIHGTCIGVDANRNFDVNWDSTVGGSTEPCSNTFKGPSAMSEPEVQNMAALLTKYDNVKLFITVHSYGKYILYPFGDGQRIENYKEHEALGKEARYAIYTLHGTYYELGNSADVLYETLGSSSDYAADQGKTVYTYVIELPGGGDAGFDIEQEKIEGVLQETFPGFRRFAELIQEEFSR